MYPTFDQLLLIIARTTGAFNTMDSSLLNKQGRRTKTMWRCVDKAFKDTRDIDEALTHLSLIMDELVEKSSLAIIDTGCCRDTVADLRQWVIVHVDKSIWKNYPVIANPYAA